MKDRRGLHPVNQANWFAPGNQAARKHGGYARYFPPDVADAAAESDPGNSVGRLEEMVQFERMRLHSVLEAKAKWDARGEYNELNATDLELSEVTTGHTGTMTKRQRPDFEQAIDRAVGRLLALISEQERIAATPAHVAPALALVLDEAEKAGLSAVDTAEQVERAGLAVPFSLQQRVRAELSTYEPPEPEGGMTDEELDALSEQYEQEVAGEDAWLEERREEVAAMHESKQQEKLSE